MTCAAPVVLAPVAALGRVGTTPSDPASGDHTSIDPGAPLWTRETETILAGRVHDAAGIPAHRAYVRLLDSDGDFTAEVVTGPSGWFRFFAAPGAWTLSVLHVSGGARAEANPPSAGLWISDVRLTAGGGPAGGDSPEPPPGA